MVDSKEEKIASRLNEAKSEIWLNLIRTTLDRTHSCALNEYPPQTEGPDGVRPFLRSAPLIRENRANKRAKEV
jgi:hypothetical protein